VTSTLKSLVFWVALVAILLGIWHFSSTWQSGSQEIAFSDFLAQVKTNTVGEVIISGQSVAGKYVGTTTEASSQNFRYCRAAGVQRRPSCSRTPASKSPSATPRPATGRRT
jgi:ATP-dependent Zn protease